MLNLSTYKNIVNLGLEEAWDFVGNPNDDSANDDIWGISGIYNNGCPFLLWQGYEVSIDQETITPSSPSATKLRSFCPNPFNPSTSVSLYLAENVKVILEVCNIKNTKVKVLVNKRMLGGKDYRFNWNGKSTDGKYVSSGIYLFKMKAGNKVQTTKAFQINKSNSY